MADPFAEPFYGPLCVYGDAVLGAACAAAPGREVPEDRFVIEAGAGCLAVIDGLGAHAGAALAASLAAAAVRAAVKRVPHVGETVDAGVLADAAFAAAETLISERSRGQPEWRAMGVAMVLALMQGDRLCLAHVGDARAYLGRGASLVRLTDDHSGAGEMLLAGLIDETAVGAHPARQPLLRVVGNNKRALPPAIGRHAMQEEDVVLLCSDGVWAALAPRAIAALLARAQPAAECAHALVQAARAAGSRDDACAVVCRPHAWQRRKEVPDAAAE